ncbi:MAG TPA: hypothetical protein PKY12_10700, partial [Catalimonadaceae bacterium]|nr:hypothetical protein [Catalimonadaceae bacterium]
MYVDGQAQFRPTKSKANTPKVNSEPSVIVGPGNPDPTDPVNEPLPPGDCTPELENELQNPNWNARLQTTSNMNHQFTYWLGRAPASLVNESYFLGINKARPASVLDVHYPLNRYANARFGLSVSTGSCAHVGLVAGDQNPSWVGSYNPSNFHESPQAAFQVRAGTAQNGVWEPNTGTFIHLNPQDERIGINTNAPQATLDVNGDLKATQAKITNLNAGVLASNGDGLLMNATPEQVAGLIHNNGIPGYIPRFGTDNILENSYIRQGLLSNGSRSIAFKYDEPDLKSHFHFGNLQTLHVDGGNSQFAYNSYSYQVAQNTWVNPKLNGNLGASRIIQFSNGQIGFWNLKSNENSSQWKSVLSLTPDRWVGIGTENPSAKLEIKAADQEAAKIALNASSDQIKAIEFQDNGSTKWQIAKAANSEDLVIGDGSLGNSIRLKKQSSGSPARFVIGSQDVSNNGGFFNIKLACDGTGIFKEL